jgi:hypothetical protein
MSFGIQTFDTALGVNFDSEDRGLRILFHQQMGLGFTGLVPVPGITPQTAVAYCLPRSADVFMCPPFPTVENGGVRITPSYLQNATTYDLVVVGYG